MNEPTLWKSSPGDPDGKLMWVVPVEPERRVWVDEDGLMRLDGLPPGRYVIVQEVTDE